MKYIACDLDDEMKSNIINELTSGDINMLVYLSNVPEATNFGMFLNQVVLQKQQQNKKGGTPKFMV